MNTLKITNDGVFDRNIISPILKKNRPVNYGACLLLIILMLLWPVLQRMVMGTDPSIGYIDPNIWLLMLFSLICFLIVTGLCWWLLQRYWMSLGLPLLGDMVLQFKQMESWQQLGFYWALFALLLLAATGSMMAVM